jgi:hypothetical protein
MSYTKGTAANILVGAAAIFVLALAQLPLSSLIESSGNSGLLLVVVSAAFLLVGCSSVVVTGRTRGCGRAFDLADVHDSPTALHTIRAASVL